MKISSPSNKAFSAFFVGVAIGIIAISLFVSHRYSYEYFLKGRVAEDAATSRLVATGLSEHLKRFEAVPSLLAQNAKVLDFFGKTFPSTDSLEQINLALKQITSDVGALDTYLVGRSGTTIAASNFDLPHSFIGRDLSFRPYVQMSIAGEKSEYFALGTTSLKRGYYFSAPIEINKTVVGVAAVKIAVDGIEANWKNSENEVIVVDNHGIVFMSTRSEWLFKSIQPLLSDRLHSVDWIENIKKTKQYPVSQLGVLKANYSPSEIADTGFLTIHRDKPLLGPPSETFVASPQRLEDAGWTIYVLSPESTVDRLAYSATFVVFLLLFIVMILIGFAVYRRSQLLKNIERQTQVKRELEIRVDERTRDLKVANDTLTFEVQERARTEKKLRSTQQELVQAGKLAALGQMSAGLSHEMNQPLSAIRTYADNAQEFLARNIISDAAENIGHIKDMSERMTELTKHLRNFARKPNQDISEVNLMKVFDAVQVIMGGRLKDTGAEMQFMFEPEPVFVMGGEGRLQQVFVNILNNSLDAMATLSDPVIEVSLDYNFEGMVTISFRDYGSGLVLDEQEKIFDPFFTTKGVNEGLGLGLSISYNVIQDFGGELTCNNHKEGGAVFSVKLMLSETEKKAAQ